MFNLVSFNVHQNLLRTVLLEKYGYRGVPIREPRGQDRTLFSARKIRGMLGWSARQTGELYWNVSVTRCITDEDFISQTPHHERSPSGRPRRIRACIFVEVLTDEQIPGIGERRIESFHRSIGNGSNTRNGFDNERTELMYVDLTTF